jgi:GTP diphosphokinase / guanosine-3',5'-bis(diphosphate) 3'-diphosphatase
MKYDYDILERAITFATKAHQGFPRKGTQTPYILHPMEAAAIVSSMTDEVEVMAAAVLHDVLEDTAITAEQLRSEFGNRVADLVCAESENKREDLPATDTWSLRKQQTIDDLRRETRIEVKMIALGDKLSNIRAINWDLQNIGNELWDRFNQKDKAMICWYYRSVADAIIELSDFPAWKELDYLIGKTFELDPTVHSTG